MMVSRKIMARYNGRCRTCQGYVGKADWVWFMKGYGVRCESCGPHTADDAPLPPRRNHHKRPWAVPSARPTTPEPDAPDAPDAADDAATGKNPAVKCGDGVWRYGFESIGEAVRDALDDYAQTERSAGILRTELERHLSGHDRWANNFTRERFLVELSNPSPDLLAAVDAMREKLVGEVAPPMGSRRKIRRGQDWGEELDPDRWFVRDLSPWERSVREACPRHTATIGCNLSVNCGVRPEQLLYRGAAALALADILTSRGMNIGIVLFDGVAAPTRTVGRGVIRYRAKDPLMPLDLSAVTFAMCEIAWYRIVGVFGGSRHWPGYLNTGKGHADKLPAADREGVDYLIESDVFGQQQAEAWLRGCLVSPEAEVRYA